MAGHLIYQATSEPLISVIIPTLDGSRNGNVDRLVGQLKSQTVQNIEIILSIGIFPNGHARNVGFELASGEYCFFIDDDLTLDSDTLLEKCLRGFVDIQDLGLIGPAKQIPPNSNYFQRRCGEQLPLAVSPVVHSYTDSDMVTHDTGWLIRADLYRQLGGEDGELLAGTDPDFKARVRRAGFRIVCAPDCRSYNPQPENLSAMIRYAFRKGTYSAWQFRFAKNRAYDTVEDHGANENQATTLTYRIMRKATHLLRALARGRILRILYDSAYSTGYAYGLLKKWSPIEKLDREQDSVIVY